LSSSSQRETQLRTQWEEELKKKQAQLDAVTQKVESRQKQEEFIVGTTCRAQNSDFVVQGNERKRNEQVVVCDLQDLVPKIRLGKNIVLQQV